MVSEMALAGDPPFIARSRVSSVRSICLTYSYMATVEDSDRTLIVGRKVDETTRK